jgi:hypothetical protein
MTQPIVHRRPFNRNRLNPARLEEMIMAACDARGLQVVKSQNKLSNIGRTPAHVLAESLWRSGIKVRACKADARS